MKIVAFGRTVKGKDHFENEDSILIDEKLKLFAVADGVSNPPGGGEASRKAVSYLKNFFKNDLKKAFVQTNEKICEERRKNFSIGYTTLTAAYIKNNLNIASVGDSPAFIVRDDEIKLITVADNIPGTHTLTQAIGEPYILPHFYELKLRNGDVVVLATDGLSNVLSEEEIFDIVKRFGKVERIANFLIAEANKKLIEYKDDKTVIVIHVSE
jgi:protein phosphatase